MSGIILLLGQIKEWIMPDKCLLKSGFLELNTAKTVTETITASGLTGSLWGYKVLK